MTQSTDRRYDAVIFDLDGTLLDTLADLAGSVNAVMEQYGTGCRYSLEQVRSFVGNGIHKLMERTIPGGLQHPQFDEIEQSFRAHYGEHCMDETEPYPGILWLLEWLQREGYGTAIVSNKADFAVKKLNSIYFKGLIPSAIGEHEGCRRKPAPDSVLRALSELGVDRTRAVYVGDSEVDIETARNAQMDCILVGWGFRSRDELLAHGADPGRIAANVKELQSMIAG